MTTLRLATLGDAEAIARVIRASFAEYAGRLRPESAALGETGETIRARLANGKAGVAEEETGELVGCVLFETVSPKEVYLGRLAVLPAWRGKGIARSLIGFVEDEARRHGAQTLSLGVRIALPANQELFAGCGFRETSRRAHPGFSEPTSMRMEKTLNPAS